MALPLPAAANPANFYIYPPTRLGLSNPTRVFVQGTLFQTHTFHLPSNFSFNSDTNITRAHTITTHLNGNAPAILSLLAAFDAFQQGSGKIEAYLMAPLSGTPEGRAIRNQLEKDG